MPCLSKSQIWFLFLWVCFLLLLKYNIMLVPGTGHSDSILLYISKGSCNNSSYNLSPYKDITLLLTTYPTLYISFPWLIYFATGNFYLLISLTNLFFFFFSLFLSSSPLATSCFFSVSITVSVLLCLSICFALLDSTYKWNHTVFV